LLRHDHCITNAAMAAFGQTAFIAGGGDSLIGNRRMIKWGNNNISNNDGVTDGANGTAGSAGAGAGGCNIGSLDLSMREHCDSFLCGEDSIANRAMAAFGQAGSGAGRCNSCISNSSMTGCCDGFGFYIAAKRAGVSLRACDSTGGVCYYSVAVRVTAIGGDLDIVIATGAALHDGVAIVCAVGSDLNCFGEGAAGVVADDPVRIHRNDVGVLIVVCTCNGAVIKSKSCKRKSVVCNI